jgi:D-3-phosphoglycerate dehydrogenase
VKRVLITTVPFGDKNRLPFNLLESASVEYLVNPLGRKLTEGELAEMAEGFDVLIAGTESITEKVFSRAKKLRLISRVGVGLDSVDLLAAKRYGVQVSYTPDAPALAVAEMTIGLLFSLLRSIHIANAQLHNRRWQRHFGMRISEVSVGIIGVGRIGTLFLNMLLSLGVKKVLLNDTKVNPELTENSRISWVEKEVIYREADVISFHVPLTGETKNMIGIDQLRLMKKDALLINTARGGIINEKDLANTLRGGHLGGVALDVFDYEPYAGELAEIERCLLTSHMGSMSIDCRTRMEIEATEEALRFLSRKPLLSLVPSEEYEMRRKE